VRLILTATFFSSQLPSLDPEMIDICDMWLRIKVEQFLEHAV